MSTLFLLFTLDCPQQSPKHRPRSFLIKSAKFYFAILRNSSSFHRRLQITNVTKLISFYWELPLDDFIKIIYYSV